MASAADNSVEPKDVPCGATVALPRLVASTRSVPWRHEAPLDVYRSVGAGRWSVLLESAQEDVDWGRYTLVGGNPLVGVELWPDRTTLWRGDGLRFTLPAVSAGGCVPLLRRVLKTCLGACSEVPLMGGGLVGYVGFGAAPLLHPVPVSPRPSFMPLASLFIPGDVVVFDAVLRRIHIMALREQGAASSGGGEVLLDRLTERVQRATSMECTEPEVGNPVGGASMDARLAPVLPRPEVEGAVAAAREAVRSGEAIQVVVAQPFASSTETDPLETYRALRDVNPSPYMFHVKLGEHTLVGSSPETMVRARNGRAVVRPIAGTRRRGATTAEDKALERELMSDPKERAEHLMLLDLARNDLSRVAKPGGVHVDSAFQVETYSHVMHLVSSVSAELEEGVDSLDVFSAAFPAGTVAGAPKVRAMQLLSELETCGRGAYAGAVGYFGSNGEVDTCICIRTLTFGESGLPGAPRVVAFGGAGVVADSEPAREYQEMVHKVAVLSEALQRASGTGSKLVGLLRLAREATCF